MWRNEIDQYALGKNIFSERKRRRLASHELADRCGINRSYLRQIECGVRLPSIRLFIAICNELHTTPDRLLYGIVDANAITENEKLVYCFKNRTEEVQRKLMKIADIIADKSNEEKAK